MTRHHPTGLDLRWLLDSPDGRLRLELVLDQAGQLAYRVLHDGRETVAASRLGVARTDGEFRAGLAFASADEEAVEHEERYVMPHGKRRVLRAAYRARTVTVTAPTGEPLAVDLRAYNDGVAFRYRFPAPADRPVTVTHELTEVTPAAEGRAWLQPTQEPSIYGPAYENLYADGVRIGTPSTGPTWDLPATFSSGGTWLLVSESGLDHGYFGSRLSAVPRGRTYTFVPPHAAEGDGVGEVTATVTPPWTLPWRVIVVSDRAGGLVESDLVSHLAPPCRLDDVAWVRPGRVSWSWWSENDSPRDLARLREYVDLAAEQGWEYSLVDANWTVHSEAQMKDLVGYAADRGVRLFLWYNSGGPHNDVTEQPRDLMHEREVRRAELARIAQWGVAGVKVDFFHSDKADGIARYLDILADAADHRLMVNFHGCTIPRGWSRTWPHLMAMEGVRGAEMLIPDPRYPHDAPRHHTHLVFTRNAVGPMDYTPVTFSDTHHPHTTTNAHELALAVVFESGLLHYADSVESYRGMSAEVRAAMSAVPAAWDETRCLEGEPGSHVVLARRHGDAWYLAGINGTDHAREVTLPLGRYGRRWRVLRDGTDRDARGRAVLTIEEISCQPDQGSTLTLGPRGGLLALPVPASAS